MIERGRPDVSIVRQCELVQVSRSSVYYVAKPITTEELELRQRIDEIYLEHPFMGSRQIARTLGRRGMPRCLLNKTGSDGGFIVPTRRPLRRPAEMWA